jgi:hypothetical protein
MRKTLPVVVICGSCYEAFGQSVPQPLAFEVASVRTHQGDLTRVASFSPSGPRLSLEGYNTFLLILARGVRPEELSGVLRVAEFTD